MIEVALRWRSDFQPDALADAEIDVLRCHLAELLQEVLRLQALTEPAE